MHVNIQLDKCFKEFETKMNHKFGNASSLHIQEQQVVTISNLGTSDDSNWINCNITTKNNVIIISENRDRENHKLTLICIMFRSCKEAISDHAIFNFFLKPFS